MQRITKTTLVIFTAVMLFAGCGSKLDWQDFESSPGGFKVMMPGEPELTQDAISTMMGNIDIYMYSVETKNAAFLITFNDMDFLRGVQLTSSDIQKFLDDGRDGAMRSFENGELVYEKEVKLNGHPGKEFQVTGSQGSVKATFTAQAFLVGERLYQIAVTTPANKVPKDDIQKFFDSFELTD